MTTWWCSKCDGYDVYCKACDGRGTSDAEQKVSRLTRQATTHARNERIMKFDEEKLVKDECSCTKAERELLDLFNCVPASLVEAWNKPHAIIGWYNELGRALAKVREERLKDRSHVA